VKPAVHLALAATFLGLIALTLWLARDDGDEPDQPPAIAPPIPREYAIPAPRNPAALDPLVKRLIEQRTAALREHEADPSRWAALGNAYHANGLSEEAATCYAIAAEIEPSNPRWTYLRSILHADRGDFDAAIAEMNRVIALDSAFVPAYWRLGFWHLDRDELDQAETMLSLASRLEEGNAIPLVGLAMLAMRRGQTSDVIVWLEPVIADWPDTPIARHLLAEAYEQSGRAEEAAAMRLGAGDQMPRWHDEWEYEIEQSRTGRERLLEGARRDLDSGRVDRAVASIEDAQSFWPDDPALLALLGESLLALGDATTARQTLREALDHGDPGDARLFLALGRAEMELEHWSDADVALQRTLSLEPDNGSAWLLLSEALARLGRLDEATNALNEAKRRAADNPAMIELLETLLHAPDAEP